MDPNIEQSIVDRLKQTNNVLVTVKNNPTVDQLSACIGLTLFLNKLGKHATAVFSGEVPSTIEFLKPELTIEKDTNSLRDFIVSLDKSKADKLRYKVEDKIVKIFITPYRTSITEADLEFSQGDFNVDVVVALGVRVREELDQTIMAHGRILHDATIISVNNTKPADLGALNWNDPKASSLSEMTAGMLDILQPNSLDAQIATAFLTGIVSETERFSNNKTTPVTMSLSAKLMAAGANQQLVSSKLQQPKPEAPTPVASATPEPTGNGGETSKTPKEVPKPNGEIEIDHPKVHEVDMDLPEVNETPKDDSEIHIDDDGNFKTGLQDKPNNEDEKPKPAGRLTLEPPTLGGELTANTVANKLDPSIDPLSGESSNARVIERSKPALVDADTDVNNSSLESTVLEPADEPKETLPNISSSQTLSSIEEQVDSPHARTAPSPHESRIEPLSQPVDSTATNSAIEPPVNDLSSILSQNSSEDTSSVDNLVAGVSDSVQSAQPPANTMPQAIGAELSQPESTLPASQDANNTDDSTGATPNIDAMRAAVEEASLGSAGAPLDPIQSLNAQILDEDINASEPVLPGMPLSSTDSPMPQPVPSPTAPPPVPPPMMPPAFTQSQDSLE